MFCTNCGQAVLENHSFCSICGTHTQEVAPENSSDSSATPSWGISREEWGSGQMVLQNSNVTVYTDFKCSYPILHHLNAEFTKLLDEGLDINATDQSGGTAAHYAVIGSNHEALEIFKKAGGDLDSTVGTTLSGDMTPMMAAIEMGNRSIIKHLLELGADPNIRNEQDMSALSAASEIQDSDIANLLIEHGADESLEDLVWMGRIRSESERVIKSGSVLALPFVRTSLQIQGFPKKERILFKKHEVVPYIWFHSTYTNLLRVAVIIGYSQPDQALGLIQRFKGQVDSSLTFGKWRSESEKFASFLEIHCPASDISAYGSGLPWDQLNHLDSVMESTIVKNSDPMKNYLKWEDVIDDGSSFSFLMESNLTRMLTWSVMHPDKARQALVSYLDSETDQTMKEAIKHASNLLEWHLNECGISKLELDPVLSRNCLDESHSECVRFGSIEHLSIKNHETP
jgi:hypothetical protein